MPNQYLLPFSYKTLVELQSKLPSIRSKQLMVALAIDDFNENIKKLNMMEIKDLEKKLVKLCYKWRDDKKIPENARGFKGSKRNM